MKHEKNIEEINLSGQHILPRREAQLHGIWQFWNPQNHSEEYERRDKEPSRRKGNILQILADIQSATSKRKLGRLLHSALQTKLTKEERKQIQESMKQRKLQL